MKKIALFLNGQRGLSVLDEILQSNHKLLVLVFSDNTSQEVINLALNKSGNIIPKLSFSRNSMDKAPNYLANYNLDLIIVAGFPYIFSLDLINAPKIACINLHAGRLPDYRGGSPLNWQIINDEKRIYVSIIKMDEGIDSGPIIKSGNFVLKDSMTILDVHKKANKVFAKLISKLLIDLDFHRIRYKVQSKQNSSYWHQRNPSDSKLHWREITARKCFNIVRSLHPLYEPAFSFRGKEKIFFKSCIESLDRVKGTPGHVVFKSGEGPFIVCSDSAVLIKEYYFENDEYNIKKLKSGDILSD